MIIGEELRAWDNDRRRQRDVGRSAEAFAVDWSRSAAHQSLRERMAKLSGQGPGAVVDAVRTLFADIAWVDAQLGALTDAHLQQIVTIRGVQASVQEALCRATAHVAYHAGQIVLLCRMYGSGDWTSLSIPKRK